MKMMFVWEAVYEGLTENWHSGGGVLVIADNLEVALQLLKSHGVADSSGVFTEAPAFTTSVVSEEDKVFIFPDAGCC